MPLKIRNIVVCCDGTWCGDGTGTTSNIKIIADSFAGSVIPSGVPGTHNDQTQTMVCFFDGVGVAGSFEDYLTEGALATNLKDRWVEAYEFIVEHVSIPAYLFSYCAHKSLVGECLKKLWTLPPRRS